MRDERQMAGLNLDRVGAHALGHEALEIGVDRSVLSRNGIEARLRPPSSVRGLASEQGLVEGCLNRIEHLCFCSRQIARKIVQKRSLAETPLVAIEDDPSRGGRRRK